MKILGRNVHIRFVDKIYDAMSYQERIRNSFKDEYLTFVTDGQLFITSSDGPDDMKWDPDKFKAKYVVRNASYVIYKKFDGDEAHYLAEIVSPEKRMTRDMFMHLEQDMVNLIKA